MNDESGKDPILRKYYIVTIVGAVAGILCWCLTSRFGRLVDDGSGSLMPVFSVTAVLAIVIFIYFWALSAKSDGHNRNRKSSMFGLFMISFVYLWTIPYSVILGINIAFDTSQAITRNVEILEKNISRYRTTTYFIKLASWRSDMNSIAMSVDKATYSDPRIAVGKPKEVTTRAGFLGYEYFVKEKAKGSTLGAPVKTGEKQ
jgi:hypothetical protein